MQHNDFQSNRSEVRETHQDTLDKKGVQEIISKAQRFFSRNRAKIQEGIKKTEVALGVITTLVNPLQTPVEKTRKSPNPSELRPQTCITDTRTPYDEKKSDPNVLTYLSEVIEGAGSDEGNQLEYVHEKRQERIEHENEMLDDMDNAEMGADPKFKKFEDKIQEIETEPLDREDVESFLDGKYKTVIATEDVVLYRIYGGGSSKEGNGRRDVIFLTSHEPRDRIVEKMELALSNRWQGEVQTPEGYTEKKLPNTREYYCEVYVPKGTHMHIGKVAPQATFGGQILEGGGYQIIVAREGLTFGSEHRIDYWGNYKKFEDTARKIEEND